MLSCPECHVSLPATASSDVLCPSCGRAFPVVDGHPDFRLFHNDPSIGWSAARFEEVYGAIGFEDGDAHAQRQGIPPEVELHRRERVKHRIARWVRDCQPERVLDLGCGNGWFALSLRNEWQVTGRITGVDVSMIQVRLFAEMVAAQEISTMTAYCANAEALPFADNSFDLAIHSEVIEHVASPQKVMAELARVVRPGGQVLLSTPSSAVTRFWRRATAAPRWLRGRFRRAPRSPLLAYDQPLSAAHLFDLANAAGLKLELCDKAVLLPHESYIQFVPRVAIQPMLGLASTLERSGRVRAMLGLHHVVKLSVPLGAAG